ncbi:MAG: Esterase/lipase [Fibrobacteria bacterium]|nr:Esterase/lipase [Fibrobacteria bacterium]
MTWPSSARLTAAFLLFLPSLLTVLPPGINAFWKLSIPVKETGFWLAPPCLALTAWCLLSWKTGWGARAASALFLAGALLYAYPLLRAIETARHLEKEFARGFGKIPLKRPVEFLRPRPLVWKDFLRGIHASSVRPVTRTYARKRETDLRLDFYPARASRESGRKAPCVVVVHGGGWDTGTRGQLPDLNPWLTAAGPEPLADGRGLCGGGDRLPSRAGARLPRAGGGRVGRPGLS